MSDALTDWSVPDDWPLESDCRWRANVLGELAQRLRRNPDCRPVLQADSPASVWLSVIVSDRERARVFVNRRYNGSDGYVLTIVSGEDAVRCDCNSLSKAAWLIGRSEGPLPTEECDTLLPLHLLYLQPLAERGYRVRCGFDFEDTVRRLSANELNRQGNSGLEMPVSRGPR